MAVDGLQSPGDDQLAIPRSSYSASPNGLTTVAGGVPGRLLRLGTFRPSGHQKLLRLRLGERTAHVARHGWMARVDGTVAAEIM